MNFEYLSSNDVHHLGASSLGSASYTSAPRRLILVSLKNFPVQIPSDWKSAEQSQNALPQVSSDPLYTHHINQDFQLLLACFLCLFVWTILYF